MKRKLFAILLSLAMIVTMMPAMTMTAFAAEHTHDDITFQPWESTTSLPNKAGDYYLTDDVTLSETWDVPAGGVNNLCLNGHVVNMTGTGNVIYINSYRTLNLYECDTVTEHKGYIDGSGLWHLDEDQSHELNIASGESSKSYTGGIITGGNNGAVMISGGTFTMNDGNIAGNASHWGGGVYIGESSGSNFTMNGGTISGNIAYYEYAMDAQGGGVCNSSGTFTMTGGTIEGNTADDGGGIWNGGMGTVKLNAANGKEISITNNKAMQVAGGIMNYTEYFHVSGKVVVKDNTRVSTGSGDNLSTTEPVIIDGALTGSEIYINHVDFEFCQQDAGVLTSGNTSELNQFFHYDGPDDFSAIKNADGEIEVVAVPAGNYLIVIPTMTGATVTANKEYTTPGDQVTITITPDEGFSLVDGTLKVKDATGNSLPLTTVTSTSFKFTMPSSMVTITAEFYAPACEVDGVSYDSVNDAIASCESGVEKTIKIKKDVILSQGIVIPSGKKIVLNLNGHVLNRGLISSTGVPSMSSDGSVINVKDGGELTITDSSPDTVHKFKEIANGDYKDLWVLDNSGTRTVKGGIITGGTGSQVSDGYYGGGIYCESGGKLSMTKGTICGNLATRSGGGACIADANLDSATICGNLSTSQSGAFGGGGLSFLAGSVTYNLKNCKIINNRCNSEAGGIYTNGDATIKITGCDISNNKAVHTGGIHLGENDICEIINTTINNNYANDEGGGIYLYYNASLTIGGKIISRGNRASNDDEDTDENNIFIPNVEGNTTYLKISTQTPLSTGSDIGVTINAESEDAWKAGAIVDSYFGNPTALKDSNYRYFVMNNEGDETLFYITKSGSNYVLADDQDPDPDPGSGGGGSSDEETGEEYTVGGNGLEIKATIEGGIAKIDNIQKDALKKFEDNVKGNSKIDSIELDFIKAEQEVKGAEFTKPTLENVQDILESKQNNVSKLVVKMSEGTVSLDARALDAVTEQANGDTIILVVDKTQNTQLTTKKQETLKEYNVNKTFEAFFESNGQRIHDFKGGVATVSMKFEPDQGSNTKNYKIYYLDDNAKMHKYATKYEGGMLVFATTHFSDYVIVYDGKTDVLLLKANASGKKIKLSWNKLDNITKYVVYSSRCGKKYKKIKTFKGNKLAIKRASGKKLKKHRAYKFYVVAYDAVGNKVMSRNIHTIYGISHGKHANVRSVKVKNKSVTLKAGSSTSMGAKYKVYGHKRHLSRSHGIYLKYFTNNPEVAKVSSSGKITAVGKGTATIYVQDVGGKYNTTKVTVK